MNSAAYPRLSLDRVSVLAILLPACIASFLFFSLQRSPGFILASLAGAAVLAVLLLYPELALALYVVIGDIKGDNRISSRSPVDLTLAVGAILLLGIVLNLFRGKRPLAPPRLYLLFIPLSVWMLVSLFYTPDFAAGTDKLARFLTVTGIVIVGPFFVLTTPQAMKRFLVGFAASAFAICAYSLTGLGGDERLASPSDNTIGLGHVACSAFIVVWFALLPRLPITRRLFLYPFLAIPALALIGSGSRGPLIALMLVVLLSVWFHRRLLADLCIFSLLGVLLVPFARLPQPSLDYLGSVLRCHNFGDVVSSRADLVSFGWDLLQRHPLIGVGIDGYRYHSLNAGVYKWPHDIFLEIACELGIPAFLLMAFIFGGAIRESFLQFRNSLNRLPIFSGLAAALLFAGIINATNTGDINSDRLTWLFVTLVFVVRGLVAREDRPLPSEVKATGFQSSPSHSVAT